MDLNAFGINRNQESVINFSHRFWWAFTATPDRYLVVCAIGQFVLLALCRPKNDQCNYLHYSLQLVIQNGMFHFPPECWTIQRLWGTKFRALLGALMAPSPGLWGPCMGAERYTPRERRWLKNPPKSFFGKVVLILLTNRENRRWLLRSPLQLLGTTNQNPTCFRHKSPKTPQNEVNFGRLVLFDILSVPCK